MIDTSALVPRGFACTVSPMTTSADTPRDDTDKSDNTDDVGIDLLTLGAAMLALILLIRRAIRAGRSILEIRTTIRSGAGRQFLRPVRLFTRSDGTYVLRGRPIDGGAARDIPLAMIETARSVGGEPPAAVARTMPQPDEDPRDPLSMPEGLLGLLASVVGAIESRTRLVVTYWNSERLIEPLRLWQQPDGTYLLEVYQVSGGASSKKGELRPSPLGGFQGFLSLSVEKIEALRLSGEPFVIRTGFAIDPQRSYGRILSQTDDRN